MDETEKVVACHPEGAAATEGSLSGVLEMLRFAQHDMTQ